MENLTKESTTLFIGKDEKLAPNINTDHLRQFLYKAAIVQLIVCSVGIVLNSLNIYAVYKAKSNLKTTAKLIICLSVSDVILDIGGILESIFTILFIDLSFYSEILIMIIETFMTIATLTCPATLVHLSVDLFLMTVYPLQYVDMQQYCIISLVVTWIFCFLTGPITRSLFAVGNMEHKSFIVAYIHSGVYSVYARSVLSTIGIVVLIILNVKICFAIRDLRMRSRHQSINQKKSSVTLFLVVATYGIFYLPCCVVVIIPAIQRLNEEQEVFLQCMYAITGAFYYLNSIADPFIYAVRNSAIRAIYVRAFEKIISCFS